MKINGTPQGQKHSDLGGKPGKVPAAGGAGGAAGSSCGSSHAVVADPTMSLADTALWTLAVVGGVAVVVWAVAAALAWCKRGDR